MGNFNFGDIGRMLALLNAWHPASANWDSLLNLLADDAVAGGHKTGAFQILASLADLLPDEIRSRLEAIAVGVAGRPSRGNLPLPIGSDAAGAAILMASALGVLDTEWMADRLLGLLAGDPDEQRWAARAARQLGWPEDIGILVTLAQAQDTNVRATAAAGLASMVAAGRDDALAVTALRRCARDPGSRVPGTIASMIANAPVRAPAANEVLDVLRSHTSAYVRATATRALEDENEPRK